MSIFETFHLIIDITNSIFSMLIDKTVVILRSIPYLQSCMVLKVYKINDSININPLIPEVIVRLPQEHDLHFQGHWI